MTEQLALDLTTPAGPATLSSFHVRSEMPLAEALAGQERAATQETVLLAWFRTLTFGTRLTPSDVHRSFDWWPLTSVRRALSNLTTKGQLVHHEKDRRQGPYGAAESTWSLA